MPDLTDIIKNSVAEATDIIPEPEAEEVPVSDSGEEAAEAVPEPSEVAEEAPTDVVDPAAEKVAQNAAQALTTPLPGDDFAKKHGLSPQGAFGKENRIPYSRVKKIVGNAEKAKDDHWTAEKTKWTEAETGYKTKIGDYEGRLGQVAQFEQVMVNDKLKFLQMLTQIPGYREIFEQIGQSKAQAGTPTTPQPDPNAMPDPDQELSDGSRVYSMEGLKALLSWQTKQAEDRISKRYAPIEQEWKANKQLETIIPEINRQVAEARQWPLFETNEPAIVKALQANPKLSLEGAYRQIVVPQLQSNIASAEQSTRAKVIEELQKAPRSTSAPTSPSKPTLVKAGAKSVEDIIKESIQHLK